MWRLIKLIRTFQPFLPLPLLGPYRPTPMMCSGGWPKVCRPSSQQQLCEPSERGVFLYVGVQCGLSDIRPCTGDWRGVEHFLRVHKSRSLTFEREGPKTVCGFCFCFCFCRRRSPTYCLRHVNPKARTSAKCQRTGAHWLGRHRYTTRQGRKVGKPGHARSLDLDLQLQCPAFGVRTPPATQDVPTRQRVV